MFDVGGIQVLASRSRFSCEECATRPLCLFFNLDSQQQRYPRPWVRERRFEKGDVLTDNGAESVYVVKSGIAFLQWRAFNGALVPIGIVGRGATFGLHGLFSEAKASQGSGVAICSGRLCEISINALKEFAVKQPRILEHLAESSIVTGDLIASWSAMMRLNGAVKKLAYAALLLADSQRASVIELPTQFGLAQLLGTTRGTVARAMAVLGKSGSLRLIERQKYQISRAELMACLS